jgi:hypothetical protein
MVYRTFKRKNKDIGLEIKLHLYTVICNEFYFVFLFLIFEQSKDFIKENEYIRFYFFLLILSIILIRKYKKKKFYFSIRRFHQFLDQLFFILSLFGIENLKKILK